MNDNLNTNVDTPEFKPVPVKLTDEELQKLLEAKPLDGQVFITDADETDDQPAPTIH